jgi:hypothetical protein
MSKEQKNIDQLLEYLVNFEDKSAINKSHEALETFKKIGFYSQTESGIQNTLNSTYSTQFWPLVIQTLFQEYEILNRKLQESPEMAFKLETLDFSSTLVSIIRMFSNACIIFCNTFIEMSGIDLIFKYLQNEALIKSYLDFYAQEHPDSELELRFDRVVRGLIGCLIHLAKIYCATKYRWRKAENGLIKCLQELSARLKKIKDCKFAIYMVLASISDDDEVPQIACLGKIIEQIANLTGELCEILRKKSGLRRIPVHLNVNDTYYREVLIIEVGMVQWSLVELINALYHVAVSDRIKQAIYEQHGLREHLRVLVCEGNGTEAELAVKLLWQLCFDERVATHVRQDTDLVARLEFLRNTTSCLYLKKNCEGILWQLSHSLSSSTTLTEKTDLMDEHVMVSYNSGSREVCLRIKRELEAIGFKVWIDVECIHGSSLESMANAIEKSWCVLMCMTENYKQSTNCRAEAEYAFSINKPIVPLVIVKFT